MRTVKSCGPGIPVLMPAQCVSRIGATGARKPVPEESAKQPLKPSRREGRDVSVDPVVPAACIFFAGGPWGRRAPGLPCALVFSRVVHPSELGRYPRREKESACLVLLVVCWGVIARRGAPSRSNLVRLHLPVGSGALREACLGQASRERGARDAGVTLSPHTPPGTS